MRIVGWSVSSFRRHHDDSIYDGYNGSVIVNRDDGAIIDDNSRIAIDYHIGPIARGFHGNNSRCLMGTGKHRIFENHAI